MAPAAMEAKEDAETKTSSPKSSASHPWPLNIFAAEWPTIQAARWSFLVSVLAVSAILCSGTYWLCDHLFSAELKAKDATIQTLSLRPESVPAQAQEIAALNAVVQQLRKERAAEVANRWPSLTKEQVSAWADALATTGLKNLNVSWDVRVEAAKFYISLQEIAQRLKIQISANGGLTSAPEIRILAAKDDPAGIALKKLFEELVADSNYPVKLDAVTSIGSGQVWLWIGVKS